MCETNSQKKLNCPHCGESLKAFSLPEGSGWDEPCQWACFNNDCSYFISGWEWMFEQYNVKASYRYRVIDLNSKKASPLAVWSDTALLDRILE